MKKIIDMATASALALLMVCIGIPLKTDKAHSRSVSGVRVNGGGATTGGTASPAPATTSKPTGSGGTRVRNLPRSRSRKRGGSTGSSGSSGSVDSYTIGAPSEQTSPTTVPSRITDVEEMLDRQQGIEREVIVTDLAGRSFVAGGMYSGIDNQLRVDTDSGRLYVDINSIQSIQFLGKDFNQVKVDMTMGDGSRVKGFLYSRLSIEFLDGELIVTTRADQLRSVRFDSKQD